MKPKQFLIPFFLISFILVFSAYHLDFETQPRVHVTQMEIKFDGLNATSTIDYDVGFLTQIYVLFFGSRNLVPYVEDFLRGFEEFQIDSVNETTAKVKLTNVSRVGSSSYIHDNRTLGSTVPTLIMIYDYPGTKGEIRTYLNVSETWSSIIPMADTDANLTRGSDYV